MHAFSKNRALHSASLYGFTAHVIMRAAHVIMRLAHVIKDFRGGLCDPNWQTARACWKRPGTPKSLGHLRIQPYEFLMYGFGGPVFEQDPLRNRYQKNLQSQLFEELQSYFNSGDLHPRTPPTPTRC